MIKILYLIDKLTLAGAQNHLLELINGLDKTKFTPELITLKDLGIKRIYGFSGIRGIFRLIKIIRLHKPDIVQAYLFSENILGAIAVKMVGVKVMITGRRDTGMLREGKFRHILAYRMTNRWVDKIVCVSEAVKNVVLEKEKVNPEKIEVIYNGVDVEKFKIQNSKFKIKSSLGIKEDELVVGMIANFSWIKGHKEFIEAIPLILKEIPHTKFLLIGDGPLRSNIEYSILNTQYSIRNKVLFLGSRKDIPELLSIMDISVNASYSEGMSNTILESMAQGVPVVATAVDGNLETVMDGITGKLVPSRNAKAMAEAIINLLKDKELRKRMSEESRKIAKERFNLEKMIGNFTDLYQRLTQPKIAFIFSQFPCYDETFILREMNFFKKEGLNFLIYSIKKRKDKIVHPEAKELIGLTHYLPFFSFKLILKNLYFALRYPLRYFSLFIEVFLNNFKNPEFLLKSVVIFPQAVGFAWQARKDKINAVHGQWATYPATTAYIIARLNNLSFSFTGHAHDIYLDTTGLKEKIEKAEFVLTCTADNKRYLLNLLNNDTQCSIRNTQYENKIIVSYHGVDLQRFKKSLTSFIPQEKEESFRILSVGSLLPCKGFDILIAACKILKDKGINFHCTIAGGGPLEKDLKRQAQEAGLTEKINFTGYITQDKLIPLYQGADVVALAVRPEIHWGIPNVLLEAMASKVVVVTVELPSTAELITDGKTGFIVPPKNPQVLAEKLIFLAKNPQLRQEIAEAGYRIVEEKFNLQKNASELKKVFEKALERRRQFAKMRNQKLIVLTYHRVTNELPDKYIKVSVDNFRKQMEFLKRHSYKSISLEEAYAFIKNGKEIPKKSILITFDDGWKDNYLNAYPILEEYGFKFAVFLTVDKIGKDKQFLNWDEVSLMAREGTDFGSHTLSHSDLSQLNNSQLYKELAESKRIIEEKIGKSVEFLCYPKGYFNLEVKRLAEEVGYQAGFSVLRGKNKAGIDPYEIRRIGIGNKDNLLSFRFKLSAAYEFLRRLFPESSSTRKNAPYKRRLNLLYIIWSLGLGGAERVVINLVKGLDKNRFKPIVCCLNDKGIFTEELERLGIKVIALKKKRGVDISVIPKIIKVIEDYQIDIVHTHLWGANFWGRISAKLARVPVVVATEHNIDNWKKWYHFLFDRWLSYGTDTIVAVSQKVKEFYLEKGISKEKIKVIYNGIDFSSEIQKSGKDNIRKEFGISQEDILLAVVGRLVEAKGHQYLFEALRSFNGRYKFKLLVIGDGPLRRGLEASVKNFQLNEKVIFTGLRKDVPKILGSVDILVLPSLREGLPLVALEAMAQGVPVVATKVGGTPEVVEDGVNGILVESANPLALAEGLRKVLDNQELLRKIRENSFRIIKERFSAEKMVKDTEALYEECLTKKYL